MEKLTKIITTIADFRCDPEFIKALKDAGMSAVRINTAHQDIVKAVNVVNNIRAVSDEIPIIIDTKGPEVRTSKTMVPFDVSAGDLINVSNESDLENQPNIMYVNYVDFCKHMSLGNKILIDDGELELTVLEHHASHLICRVENNGTIKPKKSVNVPGVELNLPSLNPKDKEYIKFAADHDIAFIAHSFVRNKEDIQALQAEIDKYGARTKIIAKIENQDGVDNIDEILPLVYGIMIARGDLAVEIAAEKIPVIQRMIINKCIHSRKVVIVATQMLHSMIENPRPTRAEIADIANAVYSGADAIMLSGETAYGKYPLEAVSYMTRTALEVEKNKGFIRDKNILPIDNEISGFLAQTAVKAIEKLNVKVIICDTHTGKTARYLSAFRGNKPIFAQCYDRRTKRELGIVYGVMADYMDIELSKTDFRHATLSKLLSQKELCMDDLIVILAGNFGRQVGPSFVEINKVSDVVNSL
ncbi:MAG: pyruvate kinase [Bacteroidota bacterium]